MQEEAAWGMRCAAGAGVGRGVGANTYEVGLTRMRCSMEHSITIVSATDGAAGSSGATSAGFSPSIPYNVALVGKTYCCLFFGVEEEAVDRE